MSNSSDPGQEAKQSKAEETQGAAQMPDGLVPAELLPSAVDALAALFPPEVSAEQLESLFPSLHAEAEGALAASPAIAADASETPSKAAAPAAERRGKRRALISAPVRVRTADLTSNSLDDITTTMNVSRLGILIASHDPAYYRSMDVRVTFPYSHAADAVQAEQPGRIVRISEMPDGRRSVAIALGVTPSHDDEFIQNSGESVHAAPAAPKIKVDRDPNSLRPLVVALDGEASVRESLKTYLGGEGYDVITVTNAQEARDVLSQCTPSLLIAEIEGEGMPGYDICSHCKATPRLKGMPVMLTTSSAYPSDYASAHSLGAVVCLAKPYRQERLGHVVRLLAPPPNANENAEPPRAADPSRRHLGNGKVSKAPSSNVNRRFHLGRKS
jgi:CheY-like chemotaxis protein